MSPDEASKKLLSQVVVTREDIARAKDYIRRGVTEPQTDHLVERWLNAQVGIVPNQVDVEAATAEENLALLARAYSLRLTFYQAAWELAASCELLVGTAALWEASAGWRTPRGSAALDLGGLKCPFPSSIWLPPLAPHPSTDPDLFLRWTDCAGLHRGVREAVNQSLGCFRRGLYLPSIVMLAAAAEAAWLECGAAVATKVGNTKLQAAVDDLYASLSRKVREIVKACDGPSGKPLLKEAGINAGRITDAEIWTTTLRERRNALHWGKAQSFIAEHSDAASLLLAAPLHLATLDALRRSAGGGADTRQ